jgi:sugar-phosphatase
MKPQAVIFDMDGLLIDSEPLWHEAAGEVFGAYGIHLSDVEYRSTTGMRSREFVEWWFAKKNVPAGDAHSANQLICRNVIEKVRLRGRALPGIAHIFNFFISKKFPIGLASSSPEELIEVVVDKLGIRPHLNAITSAAALPMGKPHPQVYLNCAGALSIPPSACIAFEDSFNGLIAAKAAGMKCVVVPSVHDSKDLRFHAADLKISSLQNFNELLMQTLP